GYHPHPPASPRQRALLRRILMHYAIAGVFILVLGLLWFAASVLLLLFSAILIAVLLTSVAGKLRQWLHLRYGYALALVLLLFVTVIGTSVWLLAPSVIEQGEQLSQTLPNAIQRARDFLLQLPMLQGLVNEFPDLDRAAPDFDALLSRAGSVFTGVFGVVANLVIVLFVSVYLAAQPQVYVSGFVTLFPKSARPRICEVLYRIGDTLGLWLIGKMISMVIVGAVTATGLTLLDVPLALVLGLVAGLFEFIPYLGPILAGVPAILIAFAHDPTLALYVLFLFIGIQIFEGYFVQPLIERRMVSLPPAMTITMQVLLALPFGLLGVALATPLTAAIAVVITMLYVQDVLGDPVHPPGGSNDSEGDE
ncbi:MAG TPA: AI-2E family transporter, partial [Noviherbaspirillum sp.]|nr:AI-2E family transporter [Noviherbaspirillum sp.]